MSEASEETAVTPGRRYVLRFALACLIMALLAAGAYLGWNGWLAAEQANVAQARNEMQKMGLAMSTMRSSRAMPSLMATMRPRIMSGHLPRWRPLACMPMTAIPPPSSPFFQQEDAQRHESESYDPEREQELYADPLVQNIFAMLHEAGKRSHCQWSREFGDDYHGLMGELTSCAKLRDFLALAYRVSGERHLFDLERLVCLNYRSEGPIICLLVAISIEALFYDELENLEDPQRFFSTSRELIYASAANLFEL